jgi:hypothetical protein
MDDVTYPIIIATLKNVIITESLLLLSAFAVFLISSPPCLDPDERSYGVMLQVFRARGQSVG